MVEQPKKGGLGRPIIIGCGVLVTLCIAFLGLGTVLNAISPSTQAPLLAPDTRTPSLPQSTEAASATEVPATETDLATLTPKPTLTSLPTLRAVASTAASTQARPTLTKAPAFTATSGSVNTPVPVDTLAPTDTQAPAATQEPTQAPITLVSLTSPISPGQDATLVVQVTAADCFLTYFAPSGTESGAKGLGATSPDGNGQCRWTWRIGPSTGSGTGRLVVNSGGQSARFDIVIQ